MGLASFFAVSFDKIMGRENRIKDFPANNFNFTVMKMPA